MEEDGKIIKRNRWYNPSRITFLASDGVTYCAWRIDEKTGQKQPIPICKVGENGVTEEDIDILLDLDEMEDNNDFNQDRLIDWTFQNQTEVLESDCEMKDRLESLEDPSTDVFSQAFPEIRKGTPEEVQLRSVVAEKLEPQQQRLYEDHIVRGLSFKEISEAEEKRTGKRVSPSGISKRWEKIFAKICKNLGVEKPRLRALSQQQRQMKSDKPE